MGRPKSFTHTWPNARRQILGGKLFRNDDRLALAERRRRNSRWMLFYLVVLLAFGLATGDMHFFGASAVGVGIGWAVGWVYGPTLARTVAAVVTATILVGGSILVFDLQDAVATPEVILMFAIVLAVVIGQYMARRSTESATS